MADPLVLPKLEMLKDLAGEKLGVSDWVDITQERIDRFADATDDHQWIHTDPERAKRDSPFGGTIAHGYLTMSMAPALFHQILLIPSATFLVNPGVERVRLRAPVRCGDRIRMHATLKKVRELPGGALRATLYVQFETEGQKRSPAFGDVLIVFYP
jgi:acyl dehydratase